MAEWYEANPNKIIDLSRSDAKEHWEKLVKGIKGRHVDWMDQLANVGGEIAKIPAHFIEGVIEEKGNPITLAASAGEGVVRSVRDLYGMVGESENPSSPLFWMRSTLRAIKSGKISQNWQEEAQQWNEARKFLWDSYKVQNGDMSVYETLPYVNMSEATSQKLRSLSNPKVAHALSFIGLELPSLLAAPFTGGASAGLAITAGATAARTAANTAAKASMYAKFMGTLTESGKRLDALAAGAALRTTGAIGTGLSKAISIPANIVEGVVGSNIDALATRGGISTAAARNAVATQAVNGMAAIGAGEVRQTVGYLGSLGLRTIAEVAGEIGEQSTLLANGVISTEHINGLSVIERVARNKMLSPSAQNLAKTLNVVVDPILQMSTAALKHGYKDAAFFTGLGYMNDRERGAVGGAAMGMVWGGYSGAVRHMWGNMNGFVQHERFIKDFDDNFTAKAEQFSPEFANFAREVTADADLSKSTKISANVRMVLQQMHLQLDAKQKKQVIVGTKNLGEMTKLLESRGVKDAEKQLVRASNGMFGLVTDGNGDLVPLIWLNPERYRPADLGHEALGHLTIWNLQTRGQLGTHLREFFGLSENEGIRTDKDMAIRAALRKSLEEALQNPTNGGTIDSIRQLAKTIYDSNADTVGSVKYFEQALKEFRAGTVTHAYEYFHQTKEVNGQQEPYIYSTTRERKGVQSPIKYIFEEFVSEHAENMFIHTNLQDLVLSPEDKPLRMYFERKYTERLARMQTELELAGVVAKYGAPLTKDGKPTIQAMIYDDGKYYRHPAMDSLLRNMVTAARNANDGPVNKLSPEMQLAVAKKHKKEFLFNIRGNGATLKGEKERNEMSANSAKGAFEVIDALPDDIKPKITVDEHGNRSADVYTMKDEVIDALVSGGYLDVESGRVAKVFRDTYMQYESSGYATGNLVYAQNIGDSHRTVVGNLFKRIFGDEVPVTNRVFVPFELKVYLKTTDGSGKPLRAQRGGFVATVMDYTAIHRRQIKTWSRADVKALWANIGEFNADFHHYMMNFLRDPSSRVDSATLFRTKFGANAEKVRDIMYETFGASKRKDESYINAPREGYFSSHENPDFPIHSLKLENLVGVEKLSAAPFPYHHGRTYEPIRRNLSTAGFEEISANVFSNGQGYRVIRERASESSAWKVFSPFGGLVGRYKEKDKAFKAAQKHLRKEMNPADILGLPTDEEWSQMNRTQRLQTLQSDGQKFNDYHEAKLLLAKNRNLSLGAVVKGGINFEPKWVEQNEIMRLFKTIMNGIPVSFNEFITNHNELSSYQASNKVNFKLGGIRIMPSQKDGYKVDSRYSGKAVKLIHNAKTGEPMVYVDTKFYESMNPSDMAEFMLQDVQSEIQHVAEAFNGDAISSSYISKESVNLSDFGYHNTIAGLINTAIDAHQRGESNANPEVVQYVEDRRKASSSATFRNILKATNSTEVDTAFAELRKDTSLPVEFRNGLEQVLVSIRGPQKSVSKDWKGNFGFFKSLIDSASRMLAPEDKNARVISFYDSKGKETVGFLTTADVQHHAEKLTELMSSLSEEQVYGVSKGLSMAFAHWAPQIAESKDLNGYAPKIEGKYNGNEVSSVTAEWTASQIGRSPNQALFIVAANEGTQVYTPAGMVFVVRPDGRTSVKGGTDAGGMVHQPLNANNARPFSRKMGTMAAQDAKVADRVRGTWFGRDKIYDKLHDLAMAIIATDSSKDGIVSGVWENYTKSNNHIEAARALSDLSNDIREQQIRHMAQATMGLALATDEGTMRSRFDSNYSEYAGRPEYEKAQSEFMNQYWDEAVADYNISAQTYWNVGSGKTVIERHYEASIASNFNRKFGRGSEYISKQISQHNAVRDKFHRLASSNFSIGSVEALRPSRREEVIRSGLAKEMRIGGKTILAFEFSDSEAYLDTSRSQNKPHLLPFAGLPDAEQAFSDYAFEVKRRSADPKSDKYIPRSMAIGKDTTLGKVFGHDSMYYYYPEMRDVRVRWRDGHGAYAVTLPNGEHIIELGVRSFAASELNLKNDPDGMVFNDPASMTSKFIGNNPLTSIVLHEAQHVLQYIGNMDDEHGHFFNLNSEVGMGHFANLLGVKTNFAQGDIISNAMKHNSIWSDADKTAAKDINIVADRIALAKDSPVVRELSRNAKPLLKRATRNLAAYVAAEVDAGRMDEGLGRRMLDIDLAQDGAENLDETLANYKKLTAIREELRTKYPSYSVNMHFDVDYRAATSALGLVRSVVSIDKATPSQRLVLIRQAFENFVDLDYIMAPSERMARETEGRRALTQDEINRTSRTYTEDTLPNGSVLGIIQKAMDSSPVETTKGLMRKQTASLDSFDSGYVNPVRTIMQSLGGIGEANGDNSAFTLLGKLSLARFLMSKGTSEMTNIHRFVMSQKGWEVVDGKLTLTTGNYVVNGDFNEAVQRLAKKFRPDSKEDGERAYYHLDSQSKENGTYTISDIAQIAGVVIESEDVLSLGNSVMDKVASDAFPPVFKVSEIKELLDKDGQYDRTAANIVMLDHIVQQLGSEKTMTKNDLLNLLAFNHADADMLYNVSQKNVGVGAAKPREGRILSREEKLRIIKLYPTQAQERVRQILKTDNIGNKVLWGGATEYKYGRFTINGGQIRFKAPMFLEHVSRGIPQADVDAFRQRISKGITARLDKHSVNFDAYTAQEIASNMNRRLERLAVLMEPVMEAAFENVVSRIKDNPVEARKLWLAMMEEYEIAALRISYMDSFSGEKYNRSGVHGFIGTFDAPFDVSTNLERGLERIYGAKDTVNVANPAEAGGYPQNARPVSNIPQGIQPSLMMLHGHFVYGTIPNDAGMARFESGIEYAPATAIKQKEKYVLNRTIESTDTNQDVGTGIGDMLEGHGVGNMRALFKEAYNNWSDDGISGLMGRLMSMTEQVKNRVQNYEAMKDYVNGVREGYSQGLESTQLEQVAWGGKSIVGYIERLRSEGKSTEEAFAILDAHVERKIEMAKSEAQDLEAVLSMQMNVMSDYATRYGAAPSDSGAVNRTPNNTASLEGMTPHRFVTNFSTQIAGTSVIRVKDKSFVDLDLSMAEPDQPTSVSLPSVTAELGVPTFVVQNVNTLANNAENVVTGIIGAAVMQDEQVVMSPNRQNPKMLAYLERLNPENQTASGVGSVMGKDVHTIVSGQMYASHNHFMTYADMMGQESNLVDWATRNHRDQINSDYQSGGIFGTTMMTNNQFLSGDRLNRGVLGMMMAPYVLLHDSMGFPMVEGTHVLNRRNGLRTEKFNELVELAKTSDMRDAAQKATFDAALKEWMQSVNRSYLDRIVYECSSAASVDGILLRMNMLNTHILAMEHPDRAERIHKANEYGAVHGFDDMYGDSGVYTSEMPRGRKKEVNRYMNEQIRLAVNSEDLWRGVFFGLAASKEIEGKAPKRNQYYNGGWRDRSDATTIAGMEGMVYGRPMTSYRRSVDKGFDVTSYATEAYMHNSQFGNAHGTDKSRYAIANKDPRQQIAYNKNTRTQVESQMSNLFDIIDSYGNEMTMQFGYDAEGRHGIKDSYYNDAMNGPAIVGGGSGSTPFTALARKYPIGVAARRRLIVNRIANIAKQLGNEEVSVQPARFTSGKRVSTTFYGLNTKEKRAEAFYLGDPTNVAFTGQSFVSRRTSERDRPSLGFAWKRLEDGRIIMNIAPDTNLGGYLDGVHGSDYVTAIGMSHRRTLGWDTETGTLIPQAPLSVIRRFYSSRDNNKLASVIAGHFNFLDPLVRMQYEAAAKVIANRVLSGVNSKRMEKSVITKNPDKMDAIYEAINRINEDNDVMDFPEDFDNSDEAVKRVIAMSEFSFMSSPEDGYRTIVLPANATLADVQKAFFAHVAHANSLVASTGYRRAMSNDTFKRGNSELPHDGSPHMNGYATPDEVTNIKATIENYTKLIGGSRNATESFTVKDIAGYALQEASSSTDSTLTKVITQATNRYGMLVPNVFRDLGVLHERITGSEGGYFMPDAERAIALNGDRSAVIDLLMPNSKHLQRYAWDKKKDNNSQIIRKSDKSGYMVGHDVISGIDAAGNPVKTRKVMAFRLESEAKAYLDRVNAGGIEAEIPSIIFREGDGRIESLNPELAHGPKSGKADIHKGLKFNPEFISTEAATFDGQDKEIFKTDGTFQVGNIDKVFATKAEAVAAQEMLLRPEAVTGKAPSVERINLSVSGVGKYEHNIREGLQFAIGGSHIQFAPKALTILRTAMVPILERNKSGVMKKVKKSVDIASGNEWYEMFMENQVSKAEMRVLGLTEFLYDHKDAKLSKEDIAKFIWAMYPSTGRLSHEMNRTPYVTNVNSPTVAIRSSASRLLAERNRHLKTIEDAIETAPEDQKGTMVAYLASMRKMHDDALQSALEQFYEKDAAAAIAGRGDVLQNAANFAHDPDSKVFSTSDLDTNYRHFSAITEPVLSAYRYMFNDAFARAKLETAANLAGFDMMLADVRSDNASINDIHNWGLAPITGKPREEVRGTVTNATFMRDKEKYGLVHVDTYPDYHGYTSGIGSYRWDTLYTDMEIKKGEQYVQSLKHLADNTEDPQQKEALMRQFKSAERIMFVRKQAQGATRNSGHKNTPSGTMQLGHARHSDVIVTAYHRANAPINEVGHSLSLRRDTIAALGIEELQSDPYQGSTFGPNTEYMLGSTFEQVESTKSVAEFKQIQKAIESKEEAKGNIAAPLEYLKTSVKTKHRYIVNHTLGRRHWEGSTPLFKYLWATQYNGKRSDVTVVFDHSVKNKISEAHKKQYGLENDYVPNVVIKDSDQGQMIRDLGDWIAEDMSGWLVPLENEAYSLMYGFGCNENVGLANSTPRQHFRYGSNTNVQGLSTYLATFGLQFNTEFMSKLDELGQHYDLEMDEMHRSPVDFDKVAIDVVLDYKRRVERMTPEKFAANSDMRNAEIFRKWQQSAVRALNYLENLYYEEGSDIVEYKNKRDTTHTRKHEYENIEDYQILKTKKAPVVMTSRHLYDHAANMELITRGAVRAEVARENAESIIRKFKGAEQKYLELTAGQQIAFDFRMRAKIAGMSPEALVDMLDKGLVPQEEWNRYTITTEKADVIRKALKNPDSLTVEDLSRSDTYKVIRGTDVDLDPSYDEPLQRGRTSQPAYAKTMLGRLFEVNAPAIVHTYLANKPDPELDALKVKYNELKAKIGDAVGEDYTYPDVIPLGEDNAYRGVMTNWYAMRALQSRKDALVVMDARHHRARYSSTANIATMVNLGQGMIIPIPFGGLRRRHVLAAGYVLHEAKKQKTHGGFLEALHAGQFPDAFLAGQAPVEWNGSNQNLKNHIRIAAGEIVAQLPELNSLGNNGILNAIDSLMDVIVTGQNRLNDDLSTTDRFIAKVRSGHATREVIHNSIKRVWGSDGEDILKRVITHFDKPQGFIINVPYGRTHGYASNYGAPLWHNKIYYSGMHDGIINQVSHDAFDVPDIKMVDGKYAIIDKKTNKVLAEGITDFNEAHERAAQNAKYLGAVPIVSNFLKTFGKMGGYAMEGFMLATSSAPSTHSTSVREGTSGRVAVEHIKMERNAGLGGTAAKPALGEEGMGNLMTSSFGNRDASTMTADTTNLGNRVEAKHGVFGPDAEEGSNLSLDHATALHAMGIRKDSPENHIAAGMHKLAGFTGPMLVIRPKYPTANHMAEAKKAIVQGIPFMSVKGVDKPETMAKEAVRMYKWYSARQNREDDEK